MTARTTLVAASLVTLLALSPSVASADDASDIKAALTKYDAAFTAKDLAGLAAFYHPEVTIYEGGGINRGWVDYRDHHLGPEMNEFLSVTFAHSNVTVNSLGAGVAYVAAEYSIKAKMKEREVDGGGLATLIMLKGTDGAWRIRHSHTSSRRRPAAPAPTPYD
jgi:uncharacterized protein (TIGR02246 family)